MLRKMIATILLCCSPTIVSGAQQSSYPIKAAPVADDRILIADSQASWASKNVNVSFFAKAASPVFTGAITVPAFTGSTYAGTSLLAAVQAALNALDETQDINISPFITTLFDDVDAATARATLDLANVNNTSDANKPISNAVAAALNGKKNAFTTTISTSQPSGGASGDIWYVVQ